MARTTTVTPPKVNAANNTQRDLVYTWDTKHRVTKLTNGFGKAISTKAYNGNSQVTTAQNATGGTTTNVYKPGDENLASTTSAAGGLNELDGYGGAGSSTEFLPGTSKGAAGSTSTYRYDGAGNLSSNTGGATNEAIVERNTDGTVKFTTDPENIGDGTTKAVPACERTVGATHYETTAPPTATPPATSPGSAHPTAPAASPPAPTPTTGTGGCPPPTTAAGTSPPTPTTRWTGSGPPPPARPATPASPTATTRWVTRPVGSMAPAR